MPKVQKPTNDRERIALLERVSAVVNAANRGDQGATHLPPDGPEEALLSEPLGNRGQRGRAAVA